MLSELNPSKKPVRVLYSYSHTDEGLRKQLETHLSLLKRQGVIEDWHDRKIGAGQEWAGQIDAHLDVADVILLLVSPDFLASDYCYDVELNRAMERHEAGEARVIPVILRPCDWQGASFGKLQALPKDAKPVTEWHSRDRAFTNIVRGIRVTVQELVAIRARGEMPLKTEPAEQSAGVARSASRTESNAWTSGCYLSPEVQMGVELARQTARSWKDSLLTIPHLLVGLASVKGGVLEQFLVKHGIDGEKWAREIECSFKHARADEGLFEAPPEPSEGWIAAFSQSDRDAKLAATQVIDERILLSAVVNIRRSYLTLLLSSSGVGELEATLARKPTPYRDSGGKDP